MGDRLRVCWLVPGFPVDSSDPTYTFLGREAVELCALGDVDLTVVTEKLRRSASWDQFEVIMLERPRDIPAKLRAVWLALRSDPSHLGSIMRSARGTYPTLWRVGSVDHVLSDGNFDVVHSHFAFPNGTCGVRIARRAGAGSIVSLRGVDLLVDESIGYGFRRDDDFDATLRRSLPLAHQCLTATSRMRHLAIEAGAPPAVTTILPNSFQPRRTPSSTLARPVGAERLLVSVGHLIKRKGFDRGIRALARLPDNHHYAIVGEGAARSSLESLSVELGVAHRVHLLGALPPEDTWAWICEADCYWFLSRVEAFGNVVLEAIGGAQSIVATRQGVALDLLSEVNPESLLDDADDADELARRTKTQIGEPPNYPDSVLDQFSPDARSVQLLSIYRAVTKGIR